MGFSGVVQRCLSQKVKVQLGEGPKVGEVKEFTYKALTVLERADGGPVGESPTKRLAPPAGAATKAPKTNATPSPLNESTSGAQTMEFLRIPG